MRDRPDPGMLRGPAARWRAGAPRGKNVMAISMDGRRADVQGYQPGPYMRFWNVWLDRK
ncbi:MAG TPA: hypothetical protein VHQ69_15485 [Methylomirabilota bacterium]|nr:hypothetical protein [Methylomirabilota bacterium]